MARRQGIGGGVSPRRSAVTAGLVAFVLLYALVVASEALLGVVVSLVVVVTAWATNPYGPVARYVGDSREG